MAHTVLSVTTTAIIVAGPGASMKEIPWWQMREAARSLASERTDPVDAQVGETYRRLLAEARVIAAAAGLSGTRTWHDGCDDCGDCCAAGPCPATWTETYDPDEIREMRQDDDRQAKLNAKIDALCGRSDGTRHRSARGARG